MARKSPLQITFTTIAAHYVTHTNSASGVLECFLNSAVLPGCLTCLVLSRHATSVSSWLLSICTQVPRVATSSSTTCHRSSPTLRYCRCSCPLETSSLQRSLWTVPPTRVNALVSHCDGYCRLGRLAFFCMR